MEMNYFKTYDNYCYFNEVEDLLKKSLLGTEIIIKKYNNDNDIRKVYFRGFRNGVFWANYSSEKNPYQNDFPVFPSKKVEIIFIGKNKIESFDDFIERISIIDNIEKEKKEKDAYRQSKMYPDPEME